MTSLRARRGGWLWPAVLAVSAVLVLVAGRQLLATPTVAADVPVATRVEAPAPPSATPRPSARRSAPGARAPGWRTRSAAPPRPAAVVAPERLVARSVGLDLPVVPQGVDRDGRMALPDQPSRLGWYRFGAAPGDDRGAVVLAGHVDSSRYGAGPLTRLAGLERGDHLSVRDARGRSTTYVVVKVQRIPKSDFAPDDVFERSGPAVLRVITCGGAYEPRHGGYQDNLVVTAAPR